MIKRLGWAMMSAVVVWGGGVGLAEGSCAGSTLALTAPPATIGAAIPVFWRIAPACAVIETGLLIGTDPEVLVPAGQPIYASRDTYHQALPVAQTGEYWIRAYARDEDNGVILSSVWLVRVLVPHPPPAGAVGSHGAPASYAGTDADFLEPAGEPHFASLRGATATTQQAGEIIEVGAVVQVVVRNSFGSRWVSSTHREEVIADLAAGVAVRGGTVTFDAAKIRQALDNLDATFQLHGFPRSGLYSVACFGAIDELAHTAQDFGCSEGFFDVLETFIGPEVRYTEGSSHSTVSVTPEVSRTESVAFSVRSSFSYFVPKAPPGKQVASATLSLVDVLAIGDFAVLRLGGKEATTIEQTQCFGPDACVLTALWDFTAEARALAAQGGGELTLTLDPIPPTTFPGSSDGTLAFYTFLLAANYPWRHTSFANSLTLTFEEACPQALTVAVKPQAVLPVIPPGNTIPPAIRNLQPQATVTATVKTCPPPGGSPPASVEVMLRVEPPAPAGADDGGHVHGARPLAAFGRLEPSLPGRPKEATCLVTTFDADGMGSCTVAYHASEVSGVETIVASATGFPNATTKITVRVPGLVNLADVQTNFWRLVGGTATHPDNHWGTPDTVTNIQLVALDVFERFFERFGGASLRINDMSLPLGGMFDICATWNPADKCPPEDQGGHFWHRTGTSVDIGRTACRGPLPEGTSVVTDCPTTERVSVARLTIQGICLNRGKATMVREANYHCEWPQ